MSGMMRLRESCVVSFRGNPRTVRRVSLLRRGAPRLLLELLGQCVDRRYLCKCKGHNSYHTKPDDRIDFEECLSESLSMKQSTASIYIDRYCL